MSRKTVGEALTTPKYIKRKTKKGLQEFAYQKLSAAARDIWLGHVESSMENLDEARTTLNELTSRMAHNWGREQ